ncbi:MAG: helix-turn-helix domain-containing protein [Clostridium sp.]
MYNIGERIKSLRKEKGLTQSDVSGEVINRVVLSRIENNLQDPTVSQLLHISKILDIDISELFRSRSTSFKRKDEFFDKIAIMYNNKEYYDIIKFYDLYKSDFGRIRDKSKNFYLGVAYFENNMFDESEKWLKKYVAYGLKEPEEVQEKIVIMLCEAFNNLCKINAMKKNISLSLHYLDMGYRFVTKFHVESSYIGLAILNNKCINYLSLMRFKKIISICRYFETTKQSICYPATYVNIHKTLSVAYLNVGDYEKAIEHTKKVIGLYEFMGEHVKKALAYTNYINSLRFSGNFQGALRISKYCREEFKKDELVLNEVLVNELIIYFNMNDYDRVENLVREINMLNLSKDFNADYNFILGTLFMREGKVSKAIKCFKNGLTFLINTNYNYDLYKLYDNLYSLTGEVIYKESRDGINLSKFELNILLENPINK